MAKSLRFVIAISIAIWGGLTACATTADVEPIRSPTLAGSLQPYQSPVPSSTVSPPTLAPTETPLPTPTPHLYQIAAGETMGSVALKFGISTKDLIAANPDVQPSLMSVGQALIIPDGEEKAIVLPTIMPLALKLSPPDCYATLSGGMWCFLLVRNETGKAAESISAEIRLFDESGRFLVSDTAFALVDRLPADEAFSLPVFFADVPANARADSTLLTAFYAPDDYLSASLRNVLTEISWDGNFAKISGDILVDGNASHVYLLATAFDSAGKIVGVRRWDFASEMKTFDLTIASLGDALERVELMVEAKP